MRIAICGSMSFAKEMLEVQKLLQNMGHQAEVPCDTELHVQKPEFVDDLDGNYVHCTENDIIRRCFDVIAAADAILLLNYPKNGMNGYIGASGLKDGKVLLGKRKSSHGAGEWAWPGGHLEYMESYEGCAKRESMEEAAIVIQNVRFLFLGNLKQYAPKHYVHVQLLADWKSGEPRVCEPKKCEERRWFGLEELPSPLFGSCEASIEAYKTGRTFFDA